MWEEQRASMLISISNPTYMRDAAALLPTCVQSSASALTSNLTYAVPHLSGAIDVLLVQQPDGSLKSSPFYGELAGRQAFWRAGRLCKLYAQRA